MDLGQAAQAVVELMSWAGPRLPARVGYELVATAKEDLESAVAFQAYSRSNYLFGVSAVEGTLYGLVALLYLPKCLRNVPDVEACAASSSADAPQVLCLARFGTSLKSQDFNKASEDEASELLEQLWSMHCLSMGFQVSSEVRFERYFGPDDEDDRNLNRRPLQATRAPAGQLDFTRAGGEQAEKSAYTDASPKGRISTLQSIPKLFDLIALITRSDYFVSLPSRTKGLTKCKVIAFMDQELLMKPELKPDLQLLKELIVSTYEKVKPDGREWEFGELDRYLVPLTVGEAHMILRALEANLLFRHLVMERPTKASLLSHERVVTDGAERARLFLARVDLPVFYHLPLTYAQLCTREARSCADAFGAFLLDKPSPFDKELRQLTLSYMWGVARGTVLHMRPEDYARAGAQDSKAWAVLKKFAFPVVVDRPQACEQELGVVAAWLCKMIHDYARYEPRHKQEWIFSQGKPEEEELTLPSLMEGVPMPCRRELNPNMG